MHGVVAERVALALVKMVGGFLVDEVALALVERGYILD